ncbi:CobW family GTP-binding protein [Belliella kenyensis]|uniref:CobW family GTP-binding protein n=1 Tax=Belliella kenyensis TaxID=1472724 RepID=A0ABV8EN21_9BACT|nr:GTP-binding protein [Belliella kenyensis]MCH7403422.1 GTP-binding protein [Belliella kenyensis]MDN3601634.1 GTP-binding protein [Belliella kenyensis]
MVSQKISVHILTGFLGSGKTTLLNQLLTFHQGKINYVIENEFGSTSIDSDLVKKNYNQLFELNNGCICCSLDQELIEVLEQLILMENLPDQLFIEASGVADAGMIAAIFKREGVMQYFDLKAVIAMVDAESFEDRLLEIPEISRQLVAADHILINKIDQVKPAYGADLKIQVSQINPFANIYLCEFGYIDYQVFEKKEKISRFTSLSSNKDITSLGHGMKSIAVSVPEPFDKEKFYAALSVTMFLHYHQIYRIKGFVKFEDSDEPVLIQSTGNKLTFSKLNFSITESPNLVLVFIGKNIERHSLEKILNRTLLIA